jgi:hypothetical protein
MCFAALAIFASTALRISFLQKAGRQLLKYKTKINDRNLKLAGFEQNTAIIRAYARICRRLVLIYELRALLGLV